MLAKLFSKLRKPSPIVVDDPAPAEDDEDALISLRNIVKTFKTAAGDFTVLKGINANFYRGEFVGVIGKSGSGKSTLINMITGIDRPTSGEIYIDGTAVHKLNENEMAIWRGKSLGIVFQFFQLLPTLSLLENIMLPMDFCNMYPASERPERAMNLLKLVEMEMDADKLPSAISGGQQQRVAIARAMANDPPIIIADEPTGNLDSRTADAVFGMFTDLVKQGKTIVMVTHDSSLAKRVSRTLLVADGEVVNEWVARALPTLTHLQMLDATHHLERPGGSDVVVSRMGEGEYFGEIDMFSGGQAIATVRAGFLPVEVMALDREPFMQLMSQSEITREALQHIVHKRKRENVMARGVPK